MTILLSRACEYGIQSVLYLAYKGDVGPIHQKKIAEDLHIPTSFLGKILQMLVKKHIITSQKGKLGGFVLARPAHSIFPYEIIEALEGEHFLEECILGFPGCNDDIPCPMHHGWKKIKKDIQNLLQRHSIADLCHSLPPKLDDIRKI